MHDPERHVGYLRQALAQDKAPIGLFLGAGCPVAIQVAHKAGKRPLIPAIAGMTGHVGDVLRGSARAAAFERLVENLRDDGLADANVEDWLSHIRGLRLVAGSGSVRGLASDDLDGLDLAIGDAIADLVDVELPNDRTPFHQLAAWAGSIPRAHPIQVFTPNYDLLLEEALEVLRTPYFDGFVGSRQSFFDLTAMEDDALPTRWLRL